MKQRIGELADVLTEGLRRNGVPEMLASIVQGQIEEALASDRFRGFLASQEAASAKAILDKLILRFDPLNFRVDIDYKN